MADALKFRQCLLPDPLLHRLEHRVQIFDVGQIRDGNHQGRGQSGRNLKGVFEERPLLGGKPRLPVLKVHGMDFTGMQQNKFPEIQAFPGFLMLQVGFSGIVIKIIPLPVLPDDLHSDFIRSKQTRAALHRHRFPGGDSPGEVGKS